MVRAQPWGVDSKAECADDEGPVLANERGREGGTDGGLKERREGKIGRERGGEGESEREAE